MMEETAYMETKEKYSVKRDCLARFFGDFFWLVWANQELYRCYNFSEIPAILNCNYKLPPMR
jgi:hypothetical protein